MKKTWIGIIIVLILALIIALTILLPKGEPKEIKIGAALPLTGEGSPYGTAAKNAIELAVSQINDNGGINSKKVIIIYEDTQLQPQETVNAVKKLINVDKVPVIIGPMASSGVEAVLPIADKNKVVIVSPSATDHELSGKSPYFFRTIIHDTYEGKLMANFAYKNLGIKKLALFYVQSAGPEGVSEVLKDNFEALGGQITITEKCDQEATDFRTQLTKIKSSDANALFFAGFAKETGRVLRQAKEIGFDKQILAHQTAEAPEVIELAGDSANGVIFASSKLESEASPVISSFYRAYQSRYNIEPQNYAANAYDAIKIIVIAIQEKGYTSEGTVEGLHNIKDYEGASGTISIDKNGDTVGSMVIKTIKDGKIVQYGN